MRNTKGQIWSLDIVFALVIFGFTLTIIALSWLKVSSDATLFQSNSAALLALQTKALSDTIVGQGYPANWYGMINTTNPTTWGGIMPGIGSSTQPGAISTYKLYALMSMSSSNYVASKSLLGVGYNYYIQINNAQNSNKSWANLSVGLNPQKNGATSSYVLQRSATLNGAPVSVTIILWTNATAGVG